MQANPSSQDVRREYVRFLPSTDSMAVMDEAFRQGVFLPLEQVFAPSFSRQAYLTEVELPVFDLVELTFVFHMDGRLEKCRVTTPEEVPFALRNPYAVYMAFITKLVEVRPDVSERALKECLFGGKLPFELLGVTRERHDSDRWRYVYVFAKSGISAGEVRAAGWLSTEFVPLDASRCLPFFKRDLGWFLAHRSQDFNALQAVKNVLSRRVDYWVDEEHMSYGAHWLLLVHLALRCCRGMVVLCTEELKHSQHAVRQELDLARFLLNFRSDFQVVKLFFSDDFTEGLPDDRPGKVFSFPYQKDGSVSAWLKTLSAAEGSGLPMESKSRSIRDIKRFHVLGTAWGSHLLGLERPSLPEMFAGSQIAPLADSEKCGKGLVQFSFLVRDCRGKLLLAGRLDDNHTLTKGETVMIAWSPFTDVYSSGKRFYPACEADIRTIYHKEVRESDELDPPRFTYLGLVTNKIKGIHYWMYTFVATYAHDGERLRRKLYLQKDNDDILGFFRVEDLLSFPFRVNPNKKADWWALKMLAPEATLLPSDWDWGESSAMPCPPPTEGDTSEQACLPACLLEKGCLFLSYADEKGRAAARDLRDVIESQCREICQRLTVYVPDYEEGGDDMDYLRCSFATVFLCTKATPQSPNAERDCQGVLEIVGDVHRLPTYQIVKLPLERGESANAVSPPGMHEWRTCNAWLEAEAEAPSERLKRVAEELMRIVML